MPPAPAQTIAPVRDAAQLALATAIVAATVSFAVHAFGIPHQMHTGKAIGRASSTSRSRSPGRCCAASAA
jgi:hypothetical protein